MQRVRRVERGKDIIDLTRLAKTWGGGVVSGSFHRPGAKKKQNELFLIS
jgi:hypothetical protein